MTFSMEGIGMVLPVKNSMADQTKGSNLMLWITAIVQIIYLVFGVICALALGPLTDMIIFHNFGSGYIFIFVIEIIYATAIFFSYPLNLFPVYRILETTKLSRNYINKTKTDRAKRIINVKILEKIFCIIVIFGMCFIAPNFVPFLGLSGALLNSTIGFFLPGAAYLKHFGGQGKLSMFSKISVWFYLIVTGLICAAGTYQSIINLF